MITSPITTNGYTYDWAITDDVIHLREWATDTAHPLEGDIHKLVKIGTAATCSIRVRDPSRRVAPEHAELERGHGRWSVVDRDSKHGLYVDGVKCATAELRPGAEISLGGGVTLIAESAQVIVLRRTLARLLGWSPAHQEAVDLALRQVRNATVQRSVLVLCGGRDERDLVPIAAELHRLTLTEQRPFIVYNPHRNTTETVEDPIRTVSDRVTALAEADGGTLCLLHDKLRRQDLIAILVAVLPPACRTQVMVCSGNAEDAETFGTAPVVIPPLSARKTEIDRLISEYAIDAAERLYCAKQARLSPAERAWIRTAAGESLPEIQKATLRLVAVRDAGNINAAATLLGISHVALTKWLDKRGFSKLDAATSRKVVRSRGGASGRASRS